MAEEKKPNARPSQRPSKPPSRNPWYDFGHDAEEVLLFILIVALLLGSLIGFFNGGRSLLGRLFPLSSNALTQVKSPVGGPVLLSGETTVYSLPDGTPLGIQPAGARGTVTAGPRFFNGERYWYVDFNSGPDGWVPESVLKNGNGGKFDPGDTPVGSGIQAKHDMTVYDSPGGPPTGSQKKGAKGVVTDGPRFANGDRYWYVDFESGPDGWVKERDLLAANGRAFNPGSTPVGSTAYATRDLSVFDSPGGKSLGTQKAGAKGVITEGPRSFGGKRYWYVDFESGPDGWVEEGNLKVPQDTPFSRFVSAVVGFFKLTSTFLSLLFLSGIVYSVIRSAQISSAQHKKEHSHAHAVSASSVAQEHTNRRWERVIAHAQSENPSDWRLAILESDIMLAELLDRMGYGGENVGEKLKKIEQSDFNTVEQAWEAHKIRNLLAHQGSDYLLSQREAQRVIGLYANVFREFRYI